MLTETKTAPVATPVIQGFVRQRLINLRTFAPPYRWLFVAVIATIGSAGVLLAVSDTLAPRVTFDFGASGQSVIALPIYLFVVAAFAFGWILVLAAAARMPPLARAVVTLVTLVVLGNVPVKHLLSYAQAPSGPDAAEFPLRLVQVVLLAVLAYWLLGGNASRGGDGAAAHPTWQQVVPVGIVALLLLGYHAADATIALTYNHAANTGVSAGLQVDYLVTLLSVIVYWGSTDFIEWAESAARAVGIAAERRQLSRPFFGLVAVVAVADLLDLLRADSLSYLLISSVTTLGFIAVVGAIALYARIDATWPPQVPLSGLLAGVGAIYILFQALTAVVPPPSEYRLYTILSVGFAISILVVSLIIVGLGRHRQQSELRASGFFMAVLAALFLAFSVPQMAYVFGIAASNATQGSVPAMRFIVSIGTLLGLLVLLVLRRLQRNLLTPLVSVLALFASLQVISIYLLYVQPLLNSNETPLVVIAAVLFLCAILWDLVLSGDQVTNTASRTFPRQTRLLFYLGYTLISAATILFFKAQVVRADVQTLDAVNGVTVELVGGVMLGVPLIAYLFIRNIGGWWTSVPRRAERLQAIPTRTESPL